MSALPASDNRFYCIGGTLAVDAQSYVERAADHALLAGLRAGDFCYVLTSRQMGKSSLMVRTAAHLQQEGTRVVVLDLTAIGTNLTPEQWYYTLLAKLGDGLDCEDELETYWERHAALTPLARWMGALREVVMRSTREPIVIFVDEIDYVRSLPFAADEFFAAIRECYNLRTRDATMRALTFCLLGVATPTGLIRDGRMTPFNIGRAVQPADFTAIEAESLAVGMHSEIAVGQRLLQRVLHWTGGQPYLTQKLCDEVRKATTDTVAAVDEVCERIFLSAHAREHDANLHFVQERVLRSPLDRAALLDTYSQVCRGSRVPDDDLNPIIHELHLSGIVRVEAGYLKVRNEIYRRVFGLRWAQENMPDAERRRQLAAFYRGVWRSVGVATALILVVSLLAVYAWKQKRIADQQTLAAQKNAQLAAEQTLAAQTSARQATDQKQLAEMRQKQITDNFVRTEDGLVKLLRSLGPLLASESKPRSQVLDCAKALHEGISEDVAQLPEVQLRQADLLREYSRLYIKLGNPKQALESAKASREIIFGWVQNRPNDLQLELRLVECENTIGDAMLGERDSITLERKTKDELEQAIATYQRGLALARDLLRTHPNDRLCAEAVFAALGNLGDVQTRLGHYESALTSYTDAKQLIEALRQTEQANPDFAERLAQSMDQIGDLLFQRRVGTDLQRARQNFEGSLALRSELLNSATEETRLIRQSNLAFSHNKLGKVLWREGKRDPSLSHYLEAIRLREQVVKSDPKNFEAKRQLAYSYHNLASQYKARWEQVDNLQQAIRYFEARLKLSQEIFEEDPSNKDWEVDYGESLNALADALMLSNTTRSRWTDAQLRARKAVDLTDSNNPRFLRTLAQALRITGQLEEGRAKLKLARELISQHELTPALEEVAKDIELEESAFRKSKPEAGNRKVGSNADRPADIRRVHGRTGR